jgi:transcriptional regulator with XRE-family HTH domain
VTDPWEAQREVLGAFIREQRKRANLSLRQLAELTSLSNPYLSQVERGLHQPSVRVLKALSGALNVSAETLMALAGLRVGMVPAVAPAGGPSEASAEDHKIPGTEEAILADSRLGNEQKAALIAVYRSMLSPQNSVPQNGATQDIAAQDSTT